MKWLIALCIVFVASCEPAYAQGNPCNVLKDTLEHVSQKYGEEVIFEGVSADGVMWLILHSKSRNGFSVIFVEPHQPEIGCFILSGLGERVADGSDLFLIGASADGTAWFFTINGTTLKIYYQLPTEEQLRLALEAEGHLIVGGDPT